MSEEKQSEYQKGLRHRVSDFLAQRWGSDVPQGAEEDYYNFVRAECLQSFKNGKRAGLASSPRPATVSGTALKNGRLRPVTPDEEQV